MRFGFPPWTGGAEGSYPLAGLTPSAGALSGITIYGGASNDGTVFKAKP